MCGIDAKREQRWNVYAIALLAFTLVSMLSLYALLSGCRARCRSTRPTAPRCRPWGAWNVAVSFVTNTNWQWYSGELTMSHLTQMLGLTVQNFVSAAVGIVVVIAIIRGIIRTRTRKLGNFWVDLVRTHGAHPAAAVAGVRRRADVAGRHPEPPRRHHRATTDRHHDAASPSRRSPAARSPRRRRSSSSARTAAGSTTPTRRTRSRTRTAITNILEIYALLLIPFALVVTFGRMVKDKRQTRVLLAVMARILVVMSAFADVRRTERQPGT